MSVINQWMIIKETYSIAIHSFLRRDLLTWLNKHAVLFIFFKSQVKHCRQSRKHTFKRQTMLLLNHLAKKTFNVTQCIIIQNTIAIIHFGEFTSDLNQKHSQTNPTAIINSSNANYNNLKKEKNLLNTTENFY